VVVLDSEIGQAVEVDSISWKRSPWGQDNASFVDLNIYMGLSADDSLGLDFLDNYLPETRTLVFSRTSYTVSAGPDSWYGIALDTPYWYTGQDNLLIEIEWSAGSGSIYSYHWQTGQPRAIAASYGDSTAPGFETTLPHMHLNGTLELEQVSFAAVKSAFKR
jgi:hypothetical protein